MLKLNGVGGTVLFSVSSGEFIVAKLWHHELAMGGGEVGELEKQLVAFHPRVLESSTVGRQSTLSSGNAQGHRSR